MYQCHGACAEVDSDTEAVAGRGFKLGCISCKRRSEVEGSATVEWYFRAKGEADFARVSPRQLESRLGAASHIHDTGYFYVTFSPPSSLFPKNVLESAAVCGAQVIARSPWNRFCRLFYTGNHRDRKAPETDVAHECGMSARPAQSDNALGSNIRFGTSCLKEFKKKIQMWVT